MLVEAVVRGTQAALDTWTSSCDIPHAPFSMREQPRQTNSSNPETRRTIRSAQSSGFNAVGNRLVGQEGLNQPSQILGTTLPEVFDDRGKPGIQLLASLETSGRGHGAGNFVPAISNVPYPTLVDERFWSAVKSKTS